MAIETAPVGGANRRPAARYQPLSSGRPQDPTLQEQAAARTRQRKVLEEAAEARDKLFWMLSVAAAVVFFIIGSSLMIWGLNEAVNG